MNQSKRKNLYDCITGAVKLSQKLIPFRTKTSSPKLPYEREKILNRLKSEEAVKEGVSSFQHVPHSLLIEHTNACNLKCIMCRHFIPHHPYHDHIDAKRVIDFITPILPRVGEIGLHGYGEPFLAKRLVETCETYSSFGVRLYAFTNMHHLPEHLLDIIKKSFLKLHVSCEGATKEIFEGLRRGGDFHKFCRNVSRVREVCGDLELIMAVVLMRQTIEQAPDLVRFAKKLGFNEITFWTINAWPDMPHLAKDTPKLYPRTANYYLKMATEVAREIGIKIAAPPPFKVPEDGRSMEDELKAMRVLPLFPGPEVEEKLRQRFPERKVPIKKPAETASSSKTRGVEIDELDKSHKRCVKICPWPLRKMQIKVNGDVSVCCHNGKLIAGSIYETESLPEIWNGSFYRRIRQTFFDGYLPKACSNCEYIHRHQGLDL